MPRRVRRGTTARALTAVAVAVVVVAVAGGVTAYASTRSDTPTYRTATVTRQSVQQVLQATGTVEPGSAATVSFPVAGTVASVRVTVGDPVTAGQVLATLDPTTLQSVLAAAKASVADARLTLHQAETGQAAGSSSGSASSGSLSGSAVSGSAVSGSAVSGSAVSAAQRRLLGSVHQVDSAVASAAADLATAAALCATAGGPVPTASASPSPSTSPSPSPTTAPGKPPAGPGGPGGSPAPTTCAEAQQRVLADETRILRQQQGISAQVVALDRLLARSSGSGSGSASGTGRSGSGSSSTAVSAAQLAADQAAVDAAEAELVVAQQNLAHAVIVSPFGGVVSSVGLTVGEQVSAGSATQAVDVVDPTSHTVALSVDVTKVPLLKVGEQATVVPDGYGRTLDATVSYVAAAPSTSGGSAYVVRLALSGATTGLRDGIQAGATVVVATAGDGLAVPTSAVHHLGTLAYVTVLDGGAPRRQAVTVGAVGPLFTQVTEGLSAGQQVVLADVDAAIPTASGNGRFGRFGPGAGTGLGGLGGAGGLGGTGGLAGTGGTGSRRG